MGHFKHLDDPKPIFDPGPKQIYDPKQVHDPGPKQIYDPHPKQVYDPPIIHFKKIIDDIQYLPPFVIDPIGPIKFDVPEGLLPFILATPHQYGGNLSVEETRKVNSQMIETLIQRAEYQITILRAQVEALTKQRENLSEQREE